MNTIHYYLNYLNNRFIDSPIVIKITVIFVTLLILIYLFAVLRTIAIIRKENLESRRRALVKDRFEEDIKKVLLSEQSLTIDEVAILLELTSPLKKWEKRHLTDLVLTIKDSTEINEFNYKQLVKVLDFVNFWETKLNQNNFEVNKDAINKLSLIKENISGTVFTKNIHSHDNTFRKLMKSEHIKFSSNDIFSFLEDDFDSDFNNLDAIRIHSALKERAKNKPLPLLMRWVRTSKNEKYKCFLISEIAYFKQLESAFHLINLYEEMSSSAIKTEIVNTLGKLKFEEAIPIIFNDFNFTTNYVQHSIITAFGNIGTDEAFDALESIYLQTQDDQLLIEIIQNMFKIDRKKTSFVVRKRDNATTIERNMLQYMQQQISLT